MIPEVSLLSRKLPSRSLSVVCAQGLKSLSACIAHSIIHITTLQSTDGAINTEIPSYKTNIIGFLSFLYPLVLISSSTIRSLDILSLD